MSKKYLLSNPENTVGTFVIGADEHFHPRVYNLIWKGKWSNLTSWEPLSQKHDVP